MSNDKILRNRKVIKDKFGDKVTPLSVRVDLETVIELDREARREGKSTSKHIDLILRDYVKSKKKKPNTRNVK